MYIEIGGGSTNLYEVDAVASVKGMQYVRCAITCAARTSLLCAFGSSINVCGNYGL